MAGLQQLKSQGRLGPCLTSVVSFLTVFRLPRFPTYPAIVPCLQNLIVL